jgi:hypothetical protein
LYEITAKRAQEAVNDADLGRFSVDEALYQRHHHGQVEE